MKKHTWMSRFLNGLCLLIMVLCPLWANAAAVSPNPASPIPAHFSLPQQAKDSLKENLPIQGKLFALNYQGSDKILLFFNIFFVLLAVSGAIPLMAFFIQFNLSGFHAFYNHYPKCQNYLPRIAVVVPAWNEAPVLEHTITIFLQLDYPRTHLRLYIVDDGSTDNTPELMSQLHALYPENIVYLRKETGGKGKAHAVNYGLAAVLSDDWSEAILLIDADISFKKDALRRMARHLADPNVGAVTAYIKMGNRSINYITRSIGFEYIVSQAIARRTQNVLGVLACLAGGAQLHSRANIERLNGKIDTSTLAEDTYTTLETQRLGKRVIYEGNAFVYAEEPRTIVELWKQRFRWGRGNLQITRAFKKVWFRPQKGSRLGSFLFGLIWFCVLLTPIFMILSAVGLVGLFLINKQHAFQLFYSLAWVSLFVYSYATLFALMIDKRTSRFSWIEGIVYPGLISLWILAFSLTPDLFLYQFIHLFHIKDPKIVNDVVLLFVETWSALCMLWAWLIYRLELMGVSTKITNFLLMIVGYGPLLCAINFAAYLAEMKKWDLKWDKTDKVTAIRTLRKRVEEKVAFDYEKTLQKDIRREYRFLCNELTSLSIISAFFIFFYIFTN